MNKELPLYTLKVDPTKKLLVNALALVEEPAIESDFMYFNKQIKMDFAMNNESMEMIGYAMIPDLKIYRRNEKTGYEYNVVFTKETIKEIAMAFFQNSYQGNLNMNHTATPANSFIYQSYIVDEEKNMMAPKGLESINGGWIVGVKVEDKKVWEDVKAGKVKGFSVEGIFNPIQVEDNDVDEEILSLLHQLENKIK